PVAALTTTEGPRYRAATISSLTQLSSDPPRFLISIEADSQMEGWLKQSGVCGLSFLPWEQQLLADRFAGLAPLADARFEDLPHFVAITGSPILSNAIGWADCRIVDQQSTGDHTLFVAEVVALGAGAARDQPPLIYYQNRYRTLR
ncbi:MAG: flavin reductase family protein, partial [Chloroflexota bacterium]